MSSVPLKQENMEKNIKSIVMADYNQALDEGYTGYLEEVLEHGCISGIVSGLIHYMDSIAFYSKHKEEVNELVQELVNETGLSLHELFKFWDVTDPLVIGTNNQNLIAWYGYETIARTLLDEMS